MADLNKLAEQLVNLSVKDVNALGAILKEEYGIEPAVAAVAAAAPAAAGEGAAAAEEKSTFDVVLQEAGQAKLKVIKAIKEITGLGLKESKEMADSLPKAIKEGLQKEEAEALKKQLEEAGATVALK